MSEQVRLLLSYDLRSGQEQTYRRFLLEEFLPQVQELGLTPTDAWHTAYGDYPARLLSLVADDLQAMQSVQRDERWQNLISTLESYTENMRQRLVSFKGGFQW